MKDKERLEYLEWRVKRLEKGSQVYTVEELYELLDRAEKASLAASDIYHELGDKLFQTCRKDKKEDE